MRGALAAHELLNSSGSIDVNGPEIEHECAVAVTGGTKFCLDELRRLEQQTGWQFSVACCNNDGLDSHCPTYYSSNRLFLSADNAGEQVWLHPPFNNVYPFIAHFLHCKLTICTASLEILSTHLLVLLFLLGRQQNSDSY